MRYYRPHPKGHKRLKNHISSAGQVNCHHLKNPMSNKHAPALFWDSPYAIALALLEHHPDLNPELVGLDELETIVIELPNFMDDSSLVNMRFLLDIQAEWYEEKSNL